MTNLNIALIGVGRWGVNLLRVLTNHPNVSLVSICDVNIEAARGLATANDTVVLNSIEDVISMDNLDAVVIASPSELHYDHVMAALAAKLHVFVEKPMALTAADALEMSIAAENNNVNLMVGHTFLYNNAVREVKSRIDSGELGDIYFFTSRRLNLGQFRQDCDVLWTLAPHDVSIIGYWMNAMPTSVSAQGLAYANPELGLAEVCFAQLNFEVSQAAHLHLSWLNPQKCREMVIIGSKKMLIYDDTQSDKIIQIFDKRVETDYNDAAEDLTDFRSRLRAGDLVIPNIRMTEPLVAEMNEFVDSIIEGRRPLTDGRHGAEVVSVLDALSTSMQANGNTVSVNIPKNNLYG